MSQQIERIIDGVEGFLGDAQEIAQKLLDLTDPTPCGLAGVWAISSVFNPACRMHDAIYTDHNFGGLEWTREQADRYFYKLCLRIAKDDKWLQFQAKVFYKLVRSPIGWMAWNT